MSFSYQSEIGAIKSILIKHARDAFISEENIHDQWQKLNYQGAPDLARSIDEYDCFVDLLRGFDIDIHFLPKNESVGLDSLYTRDASIVCDKGIILCNMGKPERRSEPAAEKQAFSALDIPIHGAITSAGRVEGGDVVWLDERTLAVGRGYRTNDAGIRQLRELLGECIDVLLVVHLPHWRGPSDVFHLMSVLSPLDRDLALVYSPLMPVPLREALLERDIKLVEVPDEEFETMGCNVLAMAPRKCIMLSGNLETKKRLELADVEVHEFQGWEICQKGCGGPTCLTRPLLRSI